MKVLGQTESPTPGLGCQPGVKVDTFSPAYTLRDDLEQRGAVVRWKTRTYTDDELIMSKAGFVPGRAVSANAVVLNTAYKELAKPDYVACCRWRLCHVLPKMHVREEAPYGLVGGRNLWKQQEVEAAGILYFGIGRFSRVEQH